jgi:hypothetical protein
MRAGGPSARPGFVGDSIPSQSTAARLEFRPAGKGGAGEYWNEAAGASAPRRPACRRYWPAAGFFVAFPDST